MEHRLPPPQMVEISPTNPPAYLTDFIGFQVKSYQFAGVTTRVMCFVRDEFSLLAVVECVLCGLGCV
jgi:uncharacterized membrane protein YagU involved in acid resistance